MASGVLYPRSPAWPRSLKERLGVSAPSSLHLIGPPAILATERTALFCSARTPGGAILRAHDAVRRLRDSGTTVASGFHSDIEKECLAILLRGEQSIIICPGRAIDSMRIPAVCRVAFDAGRVLFLSPFSAQPRRVTRESALQRNEFVAALAHRAYVAHAEHGGETERIVARLREWEVPLL